MSEHRTQQEQQTTLILGGTGKIGSRIARRLRDRGVRLRIGSRSGEPPFEWTDETTWAPALRGVGSAYVSYYPDVAAPGAADTIRKFADLAVRSGVRRLVLLSGRGEEEAQRAEGAIQRSGAEWTIVRSSWFNQNFSENFLLDGVLRGELALPAGDVREPFTDAEDIADVAAAALTEDGHAGQVYELTGPRLLTFAEAVEEIARATSREIRYVQVSPEEFASALAAENVPPDFVWLLNYLFRTVLDGRNEHLTDGVQRALGRAPRDFSDYARETAATGVWSAAAVESQGVRSAA